MPVYEGKANQDNVKSAIDRVAGLTNEERAVLWQVANKAWKSTKNPYDTTVGEEVYRLHNDN